MPLADFELDPQQREAVYYSGNALEVLAGPGSGKTRVVTHRIARLVLEYRAPPDRIVALTFTNRAAAEMRSRVKELLGTDTLVSAGTFHWLCAGLLRRWGRSIGIRPNFSVLRTGEANRALAAVLAETGGSRGLPIATAALLMSACKSGLEIVDAAARYGVASDTARELLGTYDRSLRALNALDLDDLPYLALQVLRQHERVKLACVARIDELLVDEYQDTNLVQQDLVFLLAPPTGTTVVVGDEDQSIYGWRFADARGFSRFAQQFPERRIVTLERSYRHYKYVGRAANALIAHNTQRTAKRIRTSLPAGDRPVCFAAANEQDEAQWIAQRILQLTERGTVQPDNVAVLYRTNTQSRPIEDALVARGFPYRVLSGQSFYQRPHVQRVISLLRLAVEESDDVAMLNLLASVRGIGPQRLNELRDGAIDARVSLYKLVENRSEKNDVPARVASEVRALLDDISKVRNARKQSLLIVCSLAAESVLGTYDRNGLATDAVRDDLEELRSVAAGRMKARATLRSFTDAIAIEEPSHGSGSGTCLLSLHAAKGLEFEAVFITGLEEGLLPHTKSLHRGADVEEERRLCYVGITRAQRRLYLSYARQRSLAGSAVTGQPSRFLEEIGTNNMTLEASTARSARARLSSTYPGARVSHARWGSGTVTMVEGDAAGGLATIRFDSVGEKRLQLRHAPLRQITEGGDVTAR